MSTLTAELDRVRVEQRSERERLQTAHAEQLALVQRSADDRVQALTDALTLARQATGTASSDGPASPEKKAPRERPASKKTPAPQAPRE